MKKIFLRYKKMDREVVGKARPEYTPSPQLLRNKLISKLYLTKKV